MEKKDIVQEILKTKGKIFSVEFEKKDGSIRKMVARLGVTKGVTGEGRKFDPMEKGLIGVYEMLADERGRMKEGQFRMINIEGIRKAKISGKELVV